MLGLVILSLVLYAFEGLGESVSYYVNEISVVFDICFLMDYCLRVYYSGSIYAKFSFAQSSSNYIVRWYGIVDAVAVFLPLLTHVLHIGYANDEFARISRLVRIMRSTRLLRFLRMMRIIREYEGLNALIGLFFPRVKRELFFSVIVIAGVVVFGTLGLYWTESASNPEYSNLANAMYWSFLSILGQGDAASISTLPAKLIAVIVILAGIALLGVITGSFTTFLVHKIGQEMKGQSRYTHKGHTLICGYNSKLPELVTRLGITHAGDEGDETLKLVLLFDRGNEEEQMPTGVRDIHWVRGNPRDTESLKMANVLEAKSIIVLADDCGHEGKKIDEDDVDARSLMTLNLIVSEFGYSKMNHDEVDDAEHVHQGIARPMITVELLTPQSIPLAKKLADHVVYADDLVCQYITIDMNTRTSTNVFERLIDPADQNIYSLGLGKSILLSKRTDKIKFLSDMSSKHRVLFLGIQIDINVLIRILHTNRKLYWILLKARLIKFVQSHLVEYNLDAMHLSDVGYKSIKPIPKVYIPILNPAEQMEIIEEILVLIGRKEEAEVHSGDVELICMCEKYPKSLQQEVLRIEV